MSDPIGMARIGRVFLLITVLAALLMAAPLCQPVLADGGDISMDFIAAAPFTYDHSTGGGFATRHV